MSPIDLLSKGPRVPLQRPSQLGPTSRLERCLTWLLCLLHLQPRKDSRLAGWGGPRADCFQCEGAGLRVGQSPYLCPIQGSWHAPRPAVVERDLMASEDQRAVPSLRVGSVCTLWESLHVLYAGRLVTTVSADAFPESSLSALVRRA